MVMQIFLLGLALFFIGGTLLPLCSHDHWVVRIFDFPRTQIAAAGPLITVVYVAFWDTGNLLQDVVLVGLMGCAVFQLYKIYPYTPLSTPQVLSVERRDEDARFSMLVANVRVSNRDAKPLRQLIQAHDPDLILTLETDDWWEAQLEELAETHPYTVKHVLDNAYGMMLHSRLRLIDAEVRFMVYDDVPSIHAQVELPVGVRFNLHQMHPRPPHPVHEPDTTERDAELLILGQEIRERPGPTVVAGDLNDVSWSYTTTLFQQTSGLLDPRIGRGVYNTFHADYPMLRYPLDHAFHSEHFKVVALERLPHIGSDHFPVLLELQYEDGASEAHDEPDADAATKVQAQREIDKLAEKRAPVSD